ncbi:MAG: NAD-dependent epimerase/dehydratase family protein [Deltaproteobacteria bacterium]|nr:NAD-dependent epimerase/dehydratase family protein [Deltaproteobacteria bacterium]
MKIFVTGSTGLLGIHLIKRLIGLNHEVYAFIREMSDISHIEDKDKIRFVKGNILDRDTLVGKMDGIDVVIHCAAITNFSSKGERKHHRGFEGNIIGTKNIAEIAKDSRIKQFIYISSCSAMGDYYNGERDETFPCQPDSEYGRSKYDSEKILTDYWVKCNFPITILRPSLIYGPYDRNGMIKIIEYIDRGLFVIFGSGKNLKSLVSAHNLVEAIICAIGNPKAFGEVFIVTDGKNYSLNDISKEIAGLLGRKQKFFHIHNKMCSILGFIGDFINFITRIEVPFSTSNLKKLMSSNTYRIDKLIRILNYNAKVSLRDGLAEEIAWYKK